MLLLVSLAILPLYLHGEKCTQVNFLGGIRRPVLIMLDHCSLAQLFQVFCRTPNSAGDDYRINSFFGLYFLCNSFCWQDQITYDFTECDSAEGRWRVAVPKKDGGCTVEGEVPVRQKGCCKQNSTLVRCLIMENESVILILYFYGMKIHQKPAGLS